MWLMVWLAIGFFGSFIARAALNAGDRQCSPITIGTLCVFLFSMWFGPVTLMAAVIWFLCYIVEDSPVSGPIKRFFKRPLANPCEWWRRRNSVN